MRKLIGTSLLTLALCCSTYAGVIPFGVTDPPPPPPSTQEATNSTEPKSGDMPFGLTAEVVLNTVNSVLSLL